MKFICKLLLNNGGKLITIMAPQNNMINSIKNPKD